MGFQERVLRLRSERGKSVVARGVAGLATEGLFTPALRSVREVVQVMGTRQDSNSLYSALMRPFAILRLGSEYSIT